MPGSTGFAGRSIESPAGFATNSVNDEVTAMTPIHHYKYFKPLRIDIIPADNMSYFTDRSGEDEEIRYGFGSCSRISHSHIEVIEIDLAWLGVIFHIVKTSEDDGWWGRVIAAKDDLPALKDLARNMVLEHFQRYPQRQQRVLEAIFEGGRTQGRLEIALGTVHLLDPAMDIARSRGTQF